MIAYGLTYRIRNDARERQMTVEARDLKSAKKKIGRKHGYKSGNMIEITKSSVIGYF